MKSKENYSGFKGTFKFIASVLSWTLLVLLILLALFLAYYAISTRIYSSKGEKFEPFVSLYTIVSGSMEPNIKVYDVVVSKKVKSPKDIKVGDVITFISTSSISKGMTITHRVVEVQEKDGIVAYRTKGDNNVSPDTAPAEYTNVIGKVVLRIPGLGRVQNFIGTQGGWLIVIVIPALIIIISDILKIFKLTGVKNRIERMEEEKKQIKEERAKRESVRKQDIKKRLNLERNLNEPDPIVTKKPSRMVVTKTMISKTKETKEEKNLTKNTVKTKENKEFITQKKAKSTNKKKKKRR